MPASSPSTVITCLVRTGAPHDLPEWARPGNGAAKQANGQPRKRRKAAAALLTSSEMAALPPPLTYGQSQLSATGQPMLPGKMAKRPYKKRQPIASTSLEAHLAASRLSSGFHAGVQHLSMLLRSPCRHSCKTAYADLRLSRKVELRKLCVKKCKGWVCQRRRPRAVTSARGDSCSLASRRPKPAASASTASTPLARRRA